MTSPNVGSQEHFVPRASQMKFSPSLLVWGWITARGLTKLHIIPQKTSVDSNYYISEILEKEVKSAFSRTKISTDLKCDKAVFSHLWWIVSAGWWSCTHVNSYDNLTDKNISQYIPPEDWSSNSPGLSPIENVWGIMHYYHNSLCWSRATNTESTRVPTSQSLASSDQFLWRLFKILLVLCLTDWKQSLTVG